MPSLPSLHAYSYIRPSFFLTGTSNVHGLAKPEPIRPVASQACQACTQVAQDLPQTQTAGMSDRPQVAKLSRS